MRGAPLQVSGLNALAACALCVKRRPTPETTIMTSPISRVVLATATLTCAVLADASTPAQARYPQYVKNACKSDFKTFCRSYDEESAALRQCMRRSAKRLSRKCQDALERSGERR